ncbi:hypothetical protein BGZ70_003661 [Mortierella alpina]|uniref:Uncharacterized protein n=1 Tax=Mortierella alpina TaxID=64518 RepID=A0A9P6ISG7_MORAP|nr:hypothetical protein BGZ70_003661 [Mortierella alpina]
MAITNKSFFLFFVVMAMFVVVSQSADAAKLPAWCSCNDKTQTVCNLAASKWDGGSCGINDQGNYIRFTQLCHRYYKINAHCWN